MKKKGKLSKEGRNGLNPKCVEKRNMEILQKG